MKNKNETTSETTSKPQSASSAKLRHLTFIPRAGFPKAWLGGKQEDFKWYTDQSFLFWYIMDLICIRKIYNSYIQHITSLKLLLKMRLSDKSDSI